MPIHALAAAAVSDVDILVAGALVVTMKRLIGNMSMVMMIFKKKMILTLMMETL